MPEDDFTAQRMERLIDRQLRKILQQELLATMRRGEDPFLSAGARQEGMSGHQGFVLLRGGALTHAHYPKPDEVTFYNDPYNRVPQTLRLSVYTQEREEDFQAGDMSAAEHQLQMRHDKGYQKGLAYLHGCFREMGATFSKRGASPTHYGMAGDGRLEKTYERDALLPHFAAPHLSDAARYLPDRITASTDLGLMPCIGLVPPDKEMGWGAYTRGEVTDGKTRYFPQDLRRMLSVTLSLLASYGQDPANAEKNGDALAAWMLDTYNATTALGTSRLKDPETKEMVGGLSLLTMAALGAKLHQPEDPAKMGVPFFLQGLEKGQDQNIGWLTSRLNAIGDWDVTVNDSFSRALLSHTLMTYRNIFPGFGRTAGNAFNFGPDAAGVSDGLYHALRTFTPTSDLYKEDLRLDGAAFARAYPNLAEEHPSLIHRANNVMRADFRLGIQEEREAEENVHGLAAHSKLPSKLTDKRRRPESGGQNGGAGGGRPGV